MEEKESSKTKEELEAEITQAMLARVADFKEQADSLTLEGVRRALEQDLGMEKFSLDAHKKFIKQCLDKCFYGADDKNASKTEGKVAEEHLQPVKEEKAGQPEDLHPTEDLSNNNSVNNENAEGSPDLRCRQADHETKQNESSQHDCDLSEDTIKNAIRKRAAYIRDNLEISMVKLRRLLEADLKLKKNSLDAYKRLISEELDEILQSSEVVEATNGAKKEPKKTPCSIDSEKTSKGVKRTRKGSDSPDSNDVSGEDEEDDEEIKRPKKRPAQKTKSSSKSLKNQKKSMEENKSSGSDSPDSNDVSGEDEEDEEEIRRPKKRPAQKTKSSSKSLKNQRKSMEENKSSGSKKKNLVAQDIDKSDESDGDKASEDGHPQSSAEEEVKKKSERPTQVYGKRVEHLKSVIKSCGLSVPPSIYKRVKQAPENKRETHLIKELEEILEREGLSTNPSEKEIKAVRKKKERAKELEGIDMSNIVSSSRRRTTSNYIPPPKPKIESESEEDEEDEDDDDNEGDSDNDGGESNEGSDGDDAEEESD